MKITSVERVGNRLIVLGVGNEDQGFRCEADLFDFDRLRIIGSAGLKDEYTRLAVEKATLNIAETLWSVVTPWPLFDPSYDEDAPCYHCGHAYYRHFDTYEGMAPVGCKYCSCHRFEVVGHCKVCNDRGTYKHRANDVYCTCPVGRRMKP